MITGYFGSKIKKYIAFSFWLPTDLLLAPKHFLGKKKLFSLKEVEHSETNLPITAYPSIIDAGKGGRGPLARTSSARM